mmetsp:Transcript_38822/g.91178  ORF Transcript_38822/g.91178 Transcript_38822/m.91178 type:complete len:217 (-) Transcript_38822:709-1359(-)
MTIAHGQAISRRTTARWRHSARSPPTKAGIMLLVKSAAMRTTGVQVCANLLISICLSVRLACASCTLLSISDMRDSDEGFVSSTSMHPFNTKVPAEMLPPFDFSTGVASPVIAASEQEASPADTMPSAGHCSPGRNEITSPICKSDICFCFPSAPCTLRTVCSCMTTRSAVATRRIAAASMIFARLKRNTTKDASKTSPCHAAAKTAIGTSSVTSI